MISVYFLLDYSIRNMAYLAESIVAQLYIIE